MPRRIKPGAIGQYFEGYQWNGRMREMHSSTCAHCQKSTDFPNMRTMMDYVDICRHCMKLICLDCYGKGCTPWIKVVEKQEEEAERKRQRGRLGY